MKSGELHRPGIQDQILILFILSEKRRCDMIKNAKEKVLKEIEEFVKRKSSEGIHTFSFDVHYPSGKITEIDIEKGKNENK